MSHCYFAFIDGAAMDGHEVLKIGQSKNPWWRFKELGTMAWIGPTHMEITSRNTDVAGAEIERFLHEFLKKHRIHGEWFHVPQDDLDLARRAVWQQFGEAFSLTDVSHVGGFDDLEGLTTNN